MLLFIHLAKTGGMSIRRMLNGLDFSYDCLHNDTLIQRRGSDVCRYQGGLLISPRDYDVICYFIRNPYDRLLSCYRYFYAGGLNQYGKKYFPGDAEVQKTILKHFPNFQTCCAALEDFCAVVQHAKPMVRSLPKLEKTKRLFIGRYEKFDTDVVRFLFLLGISIQQENILVANKTKFTFGVDYTKAMKAQIYEFYKEDFDRFGYSR